MIKNADYFASSEEIESSHDAPKFKISDRVRITKDKVTVVIYSVWKSNPWTYIITDLNGEKTIGTIYEKELFLSKL